MRPPVAAGGSAARYKEVCFLPAGDDLMRCVDLYNQTQSKWFEEMVTTCMVTP